MLNCNPSAYPIADRRIFVVVKLSSVVPVNVAPAGLVSVDGTPYHYRLLASITDIGAEQWDRLMGIDNPFTRYAFLHALETSGSATRLTGWRPRHLCLYQDKGAQERLPTSSLAPDVDASRHGSDYELIAVMPLYEKHHSYGEYVFDWAWAEAYERHQINYYPKLVNAIPFTPVQGQRVGMAAHLASASSDIIRVLQRILTQLLHTQGYSSWHSLFVEPTQQLATPSMSCLIRKGAQFHWRNRNEHGHAYADFNDYLRRFSSKKRKNIVKERAKVSAAGLRCYFVEGRDILPEQWQYFIQCYQSTYMKRSGHKGYLTVDFFHQIASSLTDSVVLLLVENAANQAVAASLFFKTHETLYGRYWGATIEADGLHFEACYYQGIDYCIANGLKVFDAGAQGEHKVLRGFEPIETCSYHDVEHQEFRQAIKHFCQQEAAQMTLYIDQMTSVLPFKKTNVAARY